MIPLRDDVPADRPAFVTYALIALNLIAYLYSVRQGGSLFGGPSAAVSARYGAIPYAFSHSGTTWSTALSAMFIHASPLHLAVNMLFLGIFAENLEDALGRVRFLIFYILGGLATLTLQVMLDPNSTAPLLGSSGALAAVLGGYILLHPRARILGVVLIVLFFTALELPALVVIGIWFAEQALLGAAGLAGSSAGTAFVAALGSFLLGIALAAVFACRRRRSPRLGLC